MPKRIDTREFDFSRPFDQDAAQQQASTLLNQEAQIDRVSSFNGSASQVRYKSLGEFAEHKDLSDHEAISLATASLKRIASALRPGDDRSGFVPDPYVKKTSAGNRIVNLQQYCCGIPVFQMERTVTIGANGSITYVDGSSAPLPPDIELTPSVAVEQAVLSAAAHIAAPGEFVSPFTGRPVQYPRLDLTGYIPRAIARFSSPPQPVVFDKGPFGDFVTAKLVFFYQGPETRLGWHILLRAELGSQYVVIVEADSKTRDTNKPALLYCQRTSSYMARSEADVWTHNPGLDVNPATGRNERQRVALPRSLADYPVEPPPALPAQFPFDWIEAGTSVTEGNCAVARFGRLDQPVTGATGADGTVLFSAAGDQSDDQKVINAFYFCNYMHDFFFLLGFDEVVNFQARNFTNEGHSGDPVKARVFHNEDVDGLASLTTGADGNAAEMLLGRVETRGPTRHTALDSDVVFHEYTHGVTHRLVGRTLDARPLQKPQSRGLDEGWSDYFAMSVQNYFLQPERTLFQDWLRDTLNREGIRPFPYDDAFPGTYDKLGGSPYDNAHGIGSLWAAILLKINRDIGRELTDRQRGHRIGWRIVFDALPNTPADPNFVQARRAILSALDDQKGRALDDAEYVRVKKVVWDVFAHFGLGELADSRDAGLTGITADFRAPSDLRTM